MKSDDRPWYVLTGGPCAGKTTLIELLDAKGYRTVPEAARTLIEQELAKGRTLEEIRSNEVAFQDDVLEMKIGTEKNLPQDEITFFDRGMHDSIAYYTFLGLPAEEKAGIASAESKYRKVFVLDSLPFETDSVRIETQAEAEKISNLLFSSYQSSGIPTLRVPVMPVDERLAFILENIDL